MNLFRQGQEGRALFGGVPVLVFQGRIHRPVDGVTGLVQVGRPLDLQCIGEGSHGGPPVGEQRGVVHHCPLHAPAVVFCLQAVLQPEHQGRLEDQGVPPAQGAGHFGGIPGGQHYLGDKACVARGAFPEGQQQAESGVLDGGQGRIPEFLPQEVRCLRVQGLDEGIFQPVFRQRTEIVPGVFQCLEQPFVDAEQVLVFPESPLIDPRLGRQQIVTESGTEQMQHPGEHRGSTAVHAGYQDQGSGFTQG